ncbi:MAG: helix-turn-helix transcriptional regulator [Rhodothermales bacterium]|nr:helix-turn-helix transcriptional regulator [Rhodothermales bacterium]MBO6778526.1 helix-turn-helix transcriptional regulator [Rhodothermales bacterium]
MSPISKELVGASARPILLSILSRGESYGYAILQRVHDLSDGQLAWKDGTLYPVLHRLCDERLITYEWRKAETGRRRKYYAITPRGEAALAVEKRQWLSVDAILARLWGLEHRLAALPG